jgi:hypothetical protein
VDVGTATGVQWKNPHALWKLATKLQRGIDKWRSWDGSMVKNVRGEMPDTPKENATVFQDFFNDLFSNDAEGGNVDEEHAKMDQRKSTGPGVLQKNGR